MTLADEDTNSILTDNANRAMFFSFSIFYSDNAEKDWTRSNTAYRESLPARDLVISPISRHFLY